MKSRKGGAEQAELILRLYELRRETAMREARSFVGGTFSPGSVEDLAGVVSEGGKKTGFMLQVYGYWDMVCAFVRHEILSEGLVYDTCQEMYFQYAKIHPYLKGFRERMNLPEWMENLETVVEGSKKGRKRVAAMRENLERILETRE